MFRTFRPCSGLLLSLYRGYSTTKILRRGWWGLILSGIPRRAPLHAGNPGFHDQGVYHALTHVVEGVRDQVHHKDLVGESAQVSISFLECVPMNFRRISCVVVLSFTLCSEVFADDGYLRHRALRAARKMMRSAPAGEIQASGNTNFDGIWGGRYFYVPRASTCGTRLNSFDFRHVFLTKKGDGYLMTNHDGDFTGRSRDKGRRWEFSRNLTVRGVPATIAVVYMSLARNGGSASTGISIAFRGGCVVSYGASAIRLAK